MNVALDRLNPHSRAARVCFVDILKNMTIQSQAEMEGCYTEGDKLTASITTV